MTNEARNMTENEDESQTKCAFLLKKKDHTASDLDGTFIPPDKKKKDTNDKEQKLGNELFVFTAEKAGMADVNAEHLRKTVYEMSKDSVFFKNSMKNNDKVDQRIKQMQEQVAKLTQPKIRFLEARIDEIVALQLECRRDLTRIKVVIDMDMFYAAVEMRDNPILRHVPLAVGSIGMISTTNYEARKFGVRSAMPGFIGKKLCPDLVFTPVRMEKYSAIAQEIRQIFAVYDPNFTAFSLDEAALDLTDYTREHWRKYVSQLSLKDWNHDGWMQDCETRQEGGHEMPESLTMKIASAIVSEIRQRIFEETQLTASAGIAVNTMLAKICSNIEKPNGQFALEGSKEVILEFIRELPVRKVGGIGKVMEKILAALNITTMQEVFDRRAVLFHVFKERTATWLLRTCLGIQEQQSESERKSYSRETTFKAVSDFESLKQICASICEHLAQDLAEDNVAARNITLKLKCADFSVRTRSVTLNTSIQSCKRLLQVALDLLKREMPISLRLLGIRAASLIPSVQREETNQVQKRQLTIQDCKMTTEGALDSMKDFGAQEEESALSNDSNKNVDKEAYAPCPICQEMIKTASLIAVNRHIDKCIEKQSIRQPKRRIRITDYME
uniref:DNA polymerase kappa n=1 Tax=Albugo laibachii Nc14 TaxID=890382 RepID=F0VZA0_9STRA|nr:DNA polymerase kappa putative [Albugo laibachii Nc14]|eukprot:CCA14130.1 DNA polymerase kappa putative [Albugo laibachii Nc14]